MLGQVAVSEAGKQIAQVGVGFDAVHLASGANQAGKARPVSATLVVTGKERVAAVHGRAADGVFDQVGVDVHATIVKKQPEAVLALQHVSHRYAEVRLARDARDLAELERVSPPQQGGNENELREAARLAADVTGLRPPGCRGPDPRGGHEPLHNPRHPGHCGKAIVCPAKGELRSPADLRNSARPSIQIGRTVAGMD